MNIIEPLNKRIVVEPEKKEKVSKGGIVIPETANQKAPTKGRVVAIADDCITMKIKLIVGSLVMFPKFAGTEIIVPPREIDGKEKVLQIIKEEDILAVVRPS